MTTIERIQQLTDEEALEAVNLLAGRLFGPTPDDEVLAQVAESSAMHAAEIRDAIAQTPLHDLAELARVALIAAAEESAEDVDAAIDSVGEKAFILEAIAVGALALGAINLAVTRGRKRTTRKTDIQVTPDGKVTIKEQETTEYVNVGSTIGSVLRNVVGAVEGSGSGGS